jgi:Peptidase M15
MFVSGTISLSRIATLSVAVATLAFATLFAAPSARADNIPFWEQADIDAKAAKSSKAKYSGKSYAKPAAKTYANKPTKKLGGYAEASEPVKKKYKGVKVAALGDSYYPSESKPKKSLSGGGVSWVASAGCLDGSLKAVVYQVAANYGPVTVNSTCRSKGHNASVGGAKKSKHLSGDAVDFRVHGNVGAVYAYLKSNGSVGGLKHYGGGLFHIDNGERRSW